MRIRSVREKRSAGVVGRVVRPVEGRRAER